MKLLFERPVPLTDALVRLGQKELLPTGMSSAELRQLSRDVRASSLFSARTTHAGYLEEIQKVADEMLAGKIDIATGRARLQDKLEELQYDPSRGFPDDTEVPPAEAGSLRDLSSDKRLKLVLETQTRHAANFALHLQGMEPEARFEFPAWELVRIYSREKEREDWPERFVRAGGSLVDGRMVALKDDEVWSELGDSDLFPDGLDSDVPPYAFSSGMGWREVSREECIELGLITGDEAPDETDARFFDETQLNADQFTREELEQLLADLRPAA